MDINIFQRKILPPKNILISYPRGNLHIIITWDECRNSDKNIVNKQIKKICYNIYKGYTQNGIFYKLNNEPLSSNRFEDYDISKNPNIENWYKVSAVYQLDDSYIEGELSLPACYQVHNTDKWFFKINERNLWILKNTGQKSPTSTDSPFSINFLLEYNFLVTQ